MVGCNDPEPEPTPTPPTPYAIYSLDEKTYPVAGVEALSRYHLSFMKDKIYQLVINYSNVEQLQEKQKLQFMYEMNDRQFRRLFVVAKKMKGSNNLNLLIVLESRIDKLVYSMGFAPTRRAARQLVTHGHVLLNGKKCSIPSTICKISIKEKSQALPVVKDTILAKTLEFVKAEGTGKTGTYVRYPQREELNPEINETYVVEWYNRLV